MSTSEMFAALRQLRDCGCVCARVRRSSALEMLCDIGWAWADRSRTKHTDQDDADYRLTPEGVEAAAKRLPSPFEQIRVAA